MKKKRMVCIMTDTHETMQVVYIDPDERALFVAEMPGNAGYTAFTQRGSDAPRRLASSGYIDKEGYASREDAQKALDLHVSNKRNESSFRRWDVVINGKSVSWDAFYEIRRGERPPPTLVPTATITVLNNIEYRIAHHMQSAYGEFLAIGRCLNEAKEGGLVPHGQWTEWVQRHTGMSERQAQRLMSAARQVNPGSTLASLPFSKLQAILALPEPEREEVARRVQDEGLSSRELQAEIKARKDAEALTQSLAGQLTAAKRDAQAYLTAKRNLEQEERNLRDKLNLRSQDMERLQKALDESLCKPDGPGGVSPEAQAEIDRLRAEIAAQEAYLEQQAERRQTAERELLQLRQQVARGEVSGADSGALTLEAFAEAVRAFVGKAGPLPHMGQHVLRMSPQEREAWQTYADMVASWLDGTRAAMSIAERVVEYDG